MDDYPNPEEVAELVSLLEGADEAREQELCDRLGVTTSFTWDLMESQGYEWDGEHWKKRQSLNA